ncbi:hypothetical protein [Streptomyces sp. NPDC013187]|uniref:hypothetical protein n=1 Tax=Streptomyces sp. NPDC013187 TaxID=3364865 RepID=UPI0036C30F3C
MRPVSVACAVGAPIAGLGVVALALPGRPEPWQAHLMCRAGATAGWAAAAVYSLGFFGVPASEHAFGDGADSIPARALAAALLFIGVGYAIELRARKAATAS